MTNREIKFKAAYSLDTGTVIVDNVVVYQDGTIGCSVVDFEKTLPENHAIDATYAVVEQIIMDPDGVYDYTPVGSIISELDDWVCFKGKPLQFTGLKDVFRKDIYEGQAVVNTHLPFKGIVTYEPQGARWIIKSERYIDLTEKTIMIGDEDGIILADIEVLGFIDQDPSLISKDEK